MELMFINVTTSSISSTVKNSIPVVQLSLGIAEDVDDADDFMMSSSAAIYTVFIIGAVAIIIISIFATGECWKSKVRKAKNQYIVRSYSGRTVGRISQNDVNRWLDTYGEVKLNSDNLKKLQINGTSLATDSFESSFQSVLIIPKVQHTDNNWYEDDRTKNPEAGDDDKYQGNGLQTCEPAERYNSPGTRPEPTDPKRPVYVYGILQTPEQHRQENGNLETSEVSVFQTPEPVPQENIKPPEEDREVSVYRTPERDPPDPPKEIVGNGLLAGEVFHSTGLKCSQV